MRIAGLLILVVTAVFATHAGALCAPLDEIRRILREDALVPPAPEVLEALDEARLPELLKQIDPYARFFPAREYQSPATGREAWIGIGAELVVRGDEIFLSVYRGGAADLAGVPDRSRLLEIDGRSVAGLEPVAVASALKGEEDTAVRLMLMRPDGRQEAVTIIREPFKPLDVEPVPPGDRQVLRIREFVAGMTRPALQATIDFLARKGAARDGQLIIDLRDAGGGDLYEAFDIAGMFLPAGTLLGSIQSRDGQPREVRSSSGDKYPMPLILIVGPDTASAAEIFAGALHRQGRAKLVGQRTYGKCSSQTDVRLSDGSVLRYTNRDVLLPGGDSCSGAGLAPDLEMSGATLGNLPMLVQEVDSAFAPK
ncbi:carboxyl-terminal processing protease [Desulfomicrobium macestii]|uniref:Carboxyl-terminal processing protease n=1 Tax=Desulfomicrobium macestii TaxID=90731 RepID=A0ABR9H4X0_9BACT|nr:S41 family peptidase [Desulfomicrobium macestii]MBE1425768.1 carboxyl-terminal processing protease [Desulfomicrobium macestii]